MGGRPLALFYCCVVVGGGCVLSALFLLVECVVGIEEMKLIAIDKKIFLEFFEEDKKLLGQERKCVCE